LAQLKTELVQKGALYSDKHPVIQSLKRQIEAMEKAAPPPPANSEAATAASLEALVAQQETLQKNLETASTKLAAARLGENLEKDQQSEKLEIIEQPAVPQEPIKPNRPKIAAIAAVLAAMAGAGLVLVMEIADKSIRRSSDLFALVDSRLIVSIPYIVTTTELRQRRRRVILASFAAGLLLTGILIGTYFFMPPLDLMIAKARVGLFR
jgi:uncharacterized protein involved in exopolysaccharide biosynthesis